MPLRSPVSSFLGPLPTTPSIFCNYLLPQICSAFPEVLPWARCCFSWLNFLPLGIHSFAHSFCKNECILICWCCVLMIKVTKARAPELKQGGRLKNTLQFCLITLANQGLAPILGIIPSLLQFSLAKGSSLLAQALNWGFPQSGYVGLCSTEVCRGESRLRRQSQL